MRRCALPLDVVEFAALVVLELALALTVAQQRPRRETLERAHGVLERHGAVVQQHEAHRVRAPRTFHDRVV